MGTLNTSINITSADTLAFSLNQTVKGAGSIGEFAESGTKTITPLLSASFASGVGLLATRTCGANGAYVFVENPTTNIHNVELIGATDLNNAVSASGGVFANITGLYSFTTLKPGDSTIVPLTSGQGDVYAYTTTGTSTINYYIADREGAFGESGIVVTTVGTTYQYAVLDSQAGVLPGGNPTPYFTSIDTGVTSSFSVDTDIVNNKGYILIFTDDQNIDHNIYKFIDAKGTTAGTLDTSGSMITIDLERMGGYVVAYNSGSNAEVNVFDGELVHTHIISGSIDGNSFDGGQFNIWEECSADGSFVGAVYDYLGNTDDTAIILFNNENHYVLSVENEPATDLSVNTAATPMYGNYFFLSTLNTSTDYYTRFQIWSTNGVLLKDIDVTDYAIDYVQDQFYGTNRLQIIANSGDNSIDYLLNYNGATNQLIGHNTTNLQAPTLNWSHAFGGATNYQYRNISSNSRYPTNLDSYDGESILIIYADNSNNTGEYINRTVDFCDLVYVVAGATTHGLYQFADDETKAIKATNLYDCLLGKSIIVPYSSNTYESGSLNILQITSTGITSGSIIPKIEDLGNNTIYSYPIGDYLKYKTYNSNTTKTTYTVIKSPKKTASLVLTGTTNQSRQRYNTSLVTDNTGEKVWYYNTNTNAFVQLQNTWQYYEDEEYNNSTSTDGLNDGNILMCNQNPNTTAKAKLRLIKKGVPTAEISIPVTDGNTTRYLGSEAAFYAYQDMADDYKWKVNVYDLDLNLKKTISLNTDTYENFDVRGRRCYIKTSNVDPLLGPNYYSYYMISLNGMAYWLHEDDDTTVFNDKYWFED